MTTPWGSKTRRLARCCCLPMWQRNTLATTPALPQIVWGLPMPAFCCFVSKHIEAHTHPRRQWHMCKHKMSQTEKYAQVYLVRVPPLDFFSPMLNISLLLFALRSIFSTISPSRLHIFFPLCPIKALLAFITLSFSRSPFHPPSLLGIHSSMHTCSLTLCWSLYTRCFQFTLCPVHIECPQWAISYSSISCHLPSSPLVHFVLPS